MKKCKTCNLKKNRRKSRARVGKVSTGAVVVGVLALAGIGLAVYLKVKDIDKKIVVESVDFGNISGGKLNMTLNLINFGSVAVPFDGFSGSVILDGDINFGTVFIKEHTMIPASGSLALPVEMKPNPLSLIGIGLDLWNSFQTRDWSGYSLELKGDIFAGDLVLPVDMKIA
jgi:hypothetical protein